MVPTARLEQAKARILPSKAKAAISWIDAAVGVFGVALLSTKVLGNSLVCSDNQWGIQR